MQDTAHTNHPEKAAIKSRKLLCTLSVRSRYLQSSHTMRVIILLLTLDVLGVSSMMTDKNLKKKVADLHGRGLWVMGMLGRDRNR